jgi:hypothetical protein
MDQKGPTEDRRLLKLLKGWMQPFALQKRYYRERIADVVDDDMHDLYQIIEAVSLEDIMTREQMALQLSFDELKDTRGLVEDETGRMKIERAMLGRSCILQTHTDVTTSRNFLVALSELRSRRRKRDQTRSIDDKFDQSAMFADMSAKPLRFVERVSPMEYPFSPAEIKLLETNEVIDGHISYQFYEQFITDMVCSQGLAPHLASHTLQQALTLKMLCTGMYPDLLPWTFPTLTEIVRVEEALYLSIPFVPLCFFGQIDVSSTTHFAVCNFLVAGELYQDVTLEMALLLQTPPYRDMAHAAFQDIIARAQ